MPAEPEQFISLMQMAHRLAGRLRFVLRGRLWGAGLDEAIPASPWHRAACESDFGNLKVDVGTVDDDFLDRAVGNAVDDGGLLFGGEVFREFDFGAEFAEGQWATGAGEGFAVNGDAFCGNAERFAGLLGEDGSTGSQRGVEGFQRIHLRAVERVIGFVLAAGNGDFHGVVDQGRVHAVFLEGIKYLYLEAYIIII